MIRNLLANKKNILFYWGPAIIIVAVIAIRLVHSYLHNPQVDFLAYLDISRAVIKNVDPYNTDNLVYFSWQRPQVSFPGIALFFVPFILMGKTAATLVFFILNCACAMGLYYLLFRVTGLWRQISFRNPDRYFMLFWILGFAYINSQPVLACLRHGQISLIVSLAMLVLLLKIKGLWKYFLFIFAAIQKYSMLTFFAPLLFVKGRYRLCIISFCGFLLFSMSPALFGVDLVRLYKDYVCELSGQVRSGFNTYQGSGYNMMQLEFFKLNAINIILKAAFVLLFLYVAAKEWKKSKFNLNLLMFVFCCSMLVAYHRVYDLGLVNALLAVKFVYMIKHRDFINAGIAALLMLFFLIPQTIYFHMCRIIGKLPLDGLVYYSDYYLGINRMFPLMPFVVMFMTLWSWYLYRFNDADFEFEGTDDVEETQTTAAG